MRTAAALRDYIRRTLTSYYHPVGSCALGTGPGAVADLQLRVHGVAGLRVADASVFPEIPNANTHATVLAVAERAAELVAAARPDRQNPPAGLVCGCALQRGNRPLQAGV